MTKPNLRPTPKSSFRTTSSIATKHELCQDIDFSELDQWFDEQLAQLEDRFQGFVTRNSLKKSIRR